MIINEDKAEAKYQIKGYAPGEIHVNETIYHQSLIISSDHLITDWPPQSLEELTQSHWEIILALQPEVILLGTGKTFKMPSRLLKSPRIGIESMSTQAACRTYMALVSEGRKVVAALLIH